MKLFFNLQAFFSILVLFSCENRQDISFNVKLIDTLEYSQAYQFTKIDTTLKNRIYCNQLFAEINAFGDSSKKANDHKFDLIIKGRSNEYKISFFKFIKYNYNGTAYNEAQQISIFEVKKINKTFFNLFFEIEVSSLFFNNCNIVFNENECYSVGNINLIKDNLKTDQTTFQYFNNSFERKYFKNISDSAPGKISHAKGISIYKNKYIVIGIQTWNGREFLSKILFLNIKTFEVLKKIEVDDYISFDIINDNLFLLSKINNKFKVLLYEIY